MQSASESSSASSSELEFLQGMSHWERRLYLARSDLASEEYWFDVALDRYQSHKQTVNILTNLARRCALEYNESNSDEDLGRLELTVAALQTVTQWREEARADITKQRERVRWQRQRAKEIEEKMQRLLIN